MVKEKIVNAMKDLLLTYDFEEITVSSLCRNANVNRSSFYKYYNNTAEVFFEIKDDILLKMLRFDDIKDNLLELLKTIERNQNLFLAVVSSKNPVLTSEWKEDCVEEFLKDKYLSKFDNKEYALKIFSYDRVAAEEIIKFWLETGCKEDCGFIADYIINTFFSICTRMNSGKM